MDRFNLFLFFVIISFFPNILFAQANKQDTVWSPFNYFIGKWGGKGEVEGVEGKYERSYHNKDLTLCLDGLRK